MTSEDSNGSEQGKSTADDARQTAPRASAPFRTEYDWSNVADPMTDEEAAEWVAALKSGKFRKAKGSLTSHGRFCCLGVEAKLRGLPRGSAGFIYGGDEDTYRRLPCDLQDALASRNDAEAGYPIEFIERGFGLGEP